MLHLHGVVDFSINPDLVERVELRYVDIHVSLEGFEPSASTSAGLRSSAEL